MLSLGRFALATALIAAVSAAEGDPLKETVKEINTAVGKSDIEAAKAAFERAVKIKGNYDPKKLAPLGAAIGKAVNHKDATLAVAAIDALGALKIAGSSKSLSQLLKPPAKPTQDRVGVYLAAIKAAGEIHDPATLKTLEKLLDHEYADLAVAGAEAYAGYRNLDGKPRMALLKKLVTSLAKLEKEAEKSKDEEKKADAEKVRVALVASMAAIARNDAAKTSEEWAAWIKQEAKAGKS